MNECICDKKNTMKVDEEYTLKIPGPPTSEVEFLGP